MTALSSLAVQSFAQTPLEMLQGKFSAGAVSIVAEYELTVQNMPVAGSSEVLVQQDMYHVKGNGLEVYCNGLSVWTIDDSSKEVVIEPCAGPVQGYMENPVLLLAELGDFFEMKSDRRVGNDTEYVMDAVKDCGIVSAKLIVSPGGIVRSGIFIMEDGTEVAVKVKSMKKTEERNPSFFSPDRKFSSDWIVTDLR